MLFIALPSTPDSKSPQSAQYLADMILSVIRPLCCHRRGGPITFFKLTTRAGSDNSIRFGGRRGGAYLRRNIRTYSSTSRKVLSALRITHVLKHKDASERGFTTTPSG